MDCPTTKLCIAVDDGGMAFTSTDAANGAWTQAGIDIDPAGGDTLATVACGSSSECVVGDWSGDVLSSTNPAGGARAWQEVSIESPDDAFGILGSSGPSAKLCILVDGSGSVITSSHPTATKASAWKFQVFGAGHDMLSGVECPSKKLCLAYPVSNGAILVSTDPTGGQKSWTSSEIDRVYSAQNHRHWLSSGHKQVCRRRQRRRPADDALRHAYRGRAHDRPYTG